MESNLKDYFAFTKKERAGILMLLGLIATGILVPYFFDTPDPSAEITVEAIRLQQAQHEQAASDQGGHLRFQPKLPALKVGYYKPGQEPAMTALFPFDPNTLDAAGWKKLGLDDHMITTIQHYKAKGGQFRKAADLQRIYGFKQADFDRLAPYIKIAAAAPFVYAARPPVKYVKAPPVIIDINQADTTAFIALPGIGNKLASRIVNFRTKLGGFVSVQQVGETFGLPDSTFQLIKPRLQCAPVALQKININTADANTLKQHPYIRWNIANAIVQYRQQHGVFRSREELQQIVLITPELFQKIVDYITVE